MATYSTSEFKGGLKLLLDGDPCTIIENEFVKPGKGQAFNRARIRNLKTGKTVDKTFKSGESVEAADVVDTEMQYLYSDGEFWHFMDAETFEQYQADENAVADALKWIRDQDVCTVTLWNGSPIAVEAPNFVVLEITERGINDYPGTYDEYLASCGDDHLDADGILTVTAKEESTGATASIEVRPSHGLEEAEIEAMLEARKQGGAFRSVFDFCDRVDLRAVNRRVVESLVKSGSFDSIDERRSALFSVASGPGSHCTSRAARPRMAAHVSRARTATPAFVRPVGLGSRTTTSSTPRTARAAASTDRP